MRSIDTGDPLDYKEDDVLKKFKVIITMLTSNAEEPLQHTFTSEAKDEGFLFRKITRNKWFKYVRQTKSDS